jgi:hypothetical protein
MQLAIKIKPKDNIQLENVKGVLNNSLSLKYCSELKIKELENKTVIGRFELELLESFPTMINFTFKSDSIYFFFPCSDKEGALLHRLYCLLKEIGFSDLDFEYSKLKLYFNRSTKRIIDELIDTISESYIYLKNKNSSIETEIYDLNSKFTGYLDKNLNLIKEKDFCLSVNSSDYVELTIEKNKDGEFYAIPNNYPNSKTLLEEVSEDLIVLKRNYVKNK